MRAVIQRVAEAEVTVAGETVGAIGRGYLILLGVGAADTAADADRLWAKIRDLRICEDEQGKTNLSLTQTAGEVLVVSQFTLYADCRRGRRRLPRRATRRMPRSSTGMLPSSRAATSDTWKRDPLARICRCAW